MPLTKVFTDVEGAAKAWARAQAEITALVGQRVFLAPNNAAPFPQVVVNRAGGGADPGEAPIDGALVTFGCWAANRHAAAALAYVVMGAAESMVPGTPMGASAVGLGASVPLGPRYVTSAADEKAGRFRYVVDVVLTVRATA